MRTRVQDCQTLTGIERELRRTDPRLTGLLDLFARLHAAEMMPAGERIRWTASRRLVLTVTALAAVLACLGLIVAAHVGVQQSAANGSEIPAGQAPAAAQSATPKYGSHAR